MAKTVVTGTGGLIGYAINKLDLPDMVYLTRKDADLTDFVKTKEVIKNGMTADIVIEVGRKENVLVVPRRAAEKRNGERIVKVFKEDKAEERKIETGLEGDNFFEVISGLKQGEDIVIE